MENRFGVKDFFIFLFLAAIVVLVILCMVQYDRQWDQLRALQSQTGALARDLTEIRRAINEGIVAAPQAVPSTGASATTKAADPFFAIKEAESQPGFARGDWLIDNFGTNIGKLTPFISTDVYASYVQNRVIETLAYRSPETFEYVPLLATSWEVSPDGLTMAFNLRRGVVFSDGHPMKAEDVVYTFDLIRNPQVDAARARSYLTDLDSVTAEGDYRVVFKFKKFLFNNFTTVAESGVMPKHFYSKFTPTQYNETPGLLMGTGAYRLPAPDSWRPGQRIELARNERYWGQPPTFDKLVYYEVKEEVAYETMYRNREVDIFGAVPEQFNKLSNDPAITSRSHVLKYQSPLGGYSYIGWNQKRGDKPTPFADKRVRQAMTLLINREQMAKDLYLGYATPASGPFGVGSPQADPALKAWPYDPERALKLLEEVGYKRGANGVLAAADGKPFSFQFTYSQGNAFTERLVLFIKDSFARAGIRVDLDAVDWPVQLDRMDKREFDAMTLGWSASVESDPFQIFHSSQTKDNGDNRTSYINPELDTLIDKARSTVEEAERMKVWQKVHAILHEDQPYTFMFNRMSLAFIDKRIQNIRPTKLGLNYVRLDVTPLPWFVPKDQQLHLQQ